jgi:predicted RecB family endonuclease
MQPPTARPQSIQPTVDEELGPVKLNTYDLGVQLEDTTASIFQKMGYSVEKRQRVQTKSGATAEIDILLVRGIRRRAVECKNYDQSRTSSVTRASHLGSLSPTRTSQKTPRSLRIRPESNCGTVTSTARSSTHMR